jgi:uncharacterized membrane protein YagU involved in acid resistance
MAGKFDLKAAALAGIIAGAVFIILEMLLVTYVAGDSPWAPPRMMAAIAMGKDVLPPPATFNLGVMTAAMVIHLALAIVYGVIFGLLVATLGLRPATAALGGLAFGVILYVVNFYLFTGLFPWFAMARNWMSLFAHAVFGLVLGIAYVRLAARPTGTSATA